MLTAALAAATLAAVAPAASATAAPSRDGHRLRTAQVPPLVLRAAPASGRRGSALRASAAATAGPREQVTGPVISTWTFDYAPRQGETALPPAQQASLQAAADLWSRLLASPVPIRVHAAAIDPGPTNAAVLAEAMPSTAYAGQGLGDNVSFYPSALARALTRGGASGGAPDDIVVLVSSTRRDFYTGTDGNVGPSQIDLESVLLHELGHGLGFGGSGDVTSGIGSLGGHDTSNPPTYFGQLQIYDRFVEDGAGKRLTTYPNGSAALAAALQSGALYWAGRGGVSAAGGSRPVLYAPTSWEDGSSYSHLDRATYPGGSANALMRPVVSQGPSSVMRSPGPITLGMFADMGWRTADLFADLAALPRFTLGHSVEVQLSSTSAQPVTYEVALRTAPHGYGSETVSRTQARFALPVAPGTTRCVMVRAHGTASDGTAVVSPWSAERCTTAPYDDRAFAARGFSRIKARGAYQSTLSVAAAPKATLARRVRGRVVALLVQRCRGCGSVEVLWNGRRIGTVSTASRRTQAQQLVVVRDLGAVRSGVLVLRTRTRQRVYVDGVGVTGV